MRINFKVVGTPGNYVLERRDDKGKPTSARPSTHEEFLLYNLLRLEETRAELKEGTIVELRKTVDQLSGLIAAMKDAWDLHVETCPEAK